MTANDCAIRLASGQPIPERVAVVVAHADDETLFVGPLLARLTDGLLIHVTDGAPTDMTDAHRLGFTTREDYAAARAIELDRAVTALGATPQRLAYGIPDQGATDAMAATAERLATDLAGTAVVVTHAYEGGHPDHDAVALAVGLARSLIVGRGDAAPAHVEFASYHLRDGERIWARFWPAINVPEHERAFDADDIARVDAALLAHASQAAVFDGWRPRVERWRAAPYYDFTQPPPPGACLYDRFGWSMTSERWQRAAGAVLGR